MGGEGFLRFGDVCCGVKREESGLLYCVKGWVWESRVRWLKCVERSAVEMVVPE